MQYLKPEKYNLKKKKKVVIFFSYALHKATSETLKKADHDSDF